MKLDCKVLLGLLHFCWDLLDEAEHRKQPWNYLHDNKIHRLISTTAIQSLDGVTFISHITASKYHIKILFYFLLASAMEITLFKFISYTSSKILLFFRRNHNVSKQHLIIMFCFYLHHSYLVCITVISALLKKTGYSVTDSYPKAEDSPLRALNYLWKSPQLIADSFTYCCLLRC